MVRGQTRGLLVPTFEPPDRISSNITSIVNIAIFQYYKLLQGKARDDNIEAAEKLGKTIKALQFAGILLSALKETFNGHYLSTRHLCNSFDFYTGFKYKYTNTNT